MQADDPTLLSRRAREIIVKADDADGAPPAAVSRAVAKVEAIKNVRDQFDSESPTVGLRDSTWLIISVLVLTVTALAWGNPKGVDLFARLIVIGGGVTMAVAVAGRKFLVKD